jgi:cell division protein FtsQ
MLNRKRTNRRREERGQRWRLPAIAWRRVGIAAGVLAVVATVGLALQWLLDQPIEQITVEGSFQRISAIEVEKAVRAQLGGAGLISVDLAAVRRALRTLDWIDQASVQRSWPRSLRVRVTEQVAVARWNTADLVNARGELFISDSRFVPPELPRLAGPPGTEAEVVARYLATQGRLVEAGMRLVALQLDARGAWELGLDNGISVRFGRRQVDERLERFIGVALRLIAQRATDIEYVDMRYTNGFAIGWRGSATRLASSTAEDRNPDA